MSMDKLKDLIELNATIGKNVRRERLKMKLTQDQMADLVHLTPGYISLIERGERGLTISNLRSFADIFGTSIKQFFDGEYTNAESDQLCDKAKKIDLIMRQINRLSDKELDFLFSMLIEMRTLNEGSEHSTDL